MSQGEIRFDDRAILVTGAGRGLGRSYALLLASRGARVIVADNGVAMDGAPDRDGLADAVVDEIRTAGGEAIACTADLATEAGAQAAVEAALDAFSRIDGILHNASTVPELTPTDLLSSDALDIVMRINAFAGLWMARAAWPHMTGARYGRIVLTSSVGIYGQSGTAPYSAAKAAAIGIMRTLAEEGSRHGIAVNVVCPSARTRMTEHFLSADYGEWFFTAMPPEKVSVAAAYLMSAACALSGEILTLGGGRVGRMVLGENVGMIGEGASIEEVRDLIPEVMADTEFFFPKNLGERSAKVAALFGFDSGHGA